MGTLHTLDRQLGELQARFPGWRIWYVPRDKAHGGTIWCAQPLPLINTDTAEHLAAEIELASPGGDPERPVDVLRGPGDTGASPGSLTLA